MDEATDDKPAGRQMVAVGFLAAVAIGALILSVMFWWDSRQSAPAQVEGSTAGTAQASDDAECDVDLVDTDSGPLSTAPATEWLAVGADYVAHSTEGHGPHVRGPGDWRACFARTPEGALFAMDAEANLFSHPQHWDEAFDYYTADMPGKEVRQAERERPNINTRWTTVGFRYLEYDGDRAVIDRAMRSADHRTLMSQVIELIWDEEHGDWRSTINDDGSRPYGFIELTDLSGFIHWEHDGPSTR